MFINDCRIKIRDKVYAVARMKGFTGNLNFIPFAQVYDGEEWTLVLREEELGNIETYSVEKGWRILTFRMILPFEMVGFLSRISVALAEAGIPIFVISSYSTDHILVKEKHIPAAIRALQKIGCDFQEG